MRNAFGDLIRVSLLFGRMLHKFLTHGLRVNPAGHEIVTSIAKDTDDLCGQCFVQNSHRGLDIRLITLRHGASLNVLTGPLSERLNVGEKLVLHPLLLFS